MAESIVRLVSRKNSFLIGEKTEQEEWRRSFGEVNKERGFMIIHKASFCKTFNQNDRL